MPILEVKDLKVGYVDVQRQTHVAVDGVGFSLENGEALGIVGESGCVPEVKFWAAVSNWRVILFLIWVRTLFAICGVK